jgi:hypothetical protein
VTNSEPDNENIQKSTVVVALRVNNSRVQKSTVVVAIRVKVNDSRVENRTYVEALRVKVDDSRVQKSSKARYPYNHVGLELVPSIQLDPIFQGRSVYDWPNVP